MMHVSGAFIMGKSTIALIGFSFAAGVVLVIVLMPLLTREPKSAATSDQDMTAKIAKPTIQKATSSQPETFPEARKAIIRILKDPDSVKFGQLFEGRGLSGKETICGEVNAKNGFGGYTGMTPFVYFVETGRAMLITNPVNNAMTHEGIEAYFKDCRS
jgi:hypothetical protein